jgi:hypothetical protein
MQRAAQMGAFLELAFVNDLMGENAADDDTKTGIKFLLVRWQQRLN